MTRTLRYASVLLLACWQLACTEEPDVVGYALPLEAGVPEDAGQDAAADGGKLDHCDPSERFKRARLPEKLVLDLYLMDCKIPLEDFTPRQGEVSISAAEFSSLLLAPQLEPEPGTSTFLCDAERGGYYFEPWNMPRRLVLCPATCELVKNEIGRVLALDGCDPQFDDAGLP
jgi:hypothetical protein